MRSALLVWPYSAVLNQHKEWSNLESLSRRQGNWTNVEFSVAKPWPISNKDECVFYHSMTYPDGESVDGIWDIRGSFEQYIGKYPIDGKTVLDVGTASGFLAFEAERSGAHVTALDALHASEFDRLHFADSLYHLDRAAHVARTERWYKRLRAGFWYSWSRYGSRVEMVYTPLARIPYWGRKFDVVIAGALIEHLADPVSVIGSLAGLAQEAVVIAFTPVIDSDAQFMETTTDWKSSEHDFTFWTLSCGLYRRIFANLGFSVEFVPARAQIGGREYVRSTIIARRVAAADVHQLQDQHAEAEAYAATAESNKEHFVGSLQQRLDAAVAERDAALVECRKAVMQRNTAAAEIAALRSSTSWTMTSPLRALSSLVRRHP